MVNKIPSYTISAGGKVAILASRSNPASAQIMALSCRETLESCGVESDDIYLIDCPDDLLLPGMSRQIAKLGYYAAVVALAAVNAESRTRQAILSGMTSSDFFVPVIPQVVFSNTNRSVLARAGEMAARSAVELINLSNMLDELVTTNSGLLDVSEDEAETVEPAPPQRSRRAAKKTAPATNGKRTRRRSTR